MKKRGWRFCTAALVFAVLLLVLCACEKERGTKGLFYTENGDGSYSVSVGEAIGESEIVIPSTYRRKPVSSVATSGFARCEKLKKLTVCEGVTAIGANAFSECTSLESVRIADSVKSIGPSAFYGCTKLSDITLPFVGEKSDGSGKTNFGFIFGASNETYHTEFVPVSLKTVVLTNTESIAPSAFYYCRYLVSVTLPENLKSIGASAFRECHRLIEVCNNSALPVGVGEIEHGFAGYYAKHIYAASDGTSHLTRENGFVFLSHNGVAELVGYEGSETALTLPNRFTAYDKTVITEYRIGEMAFSSNTDIVSVILPSAVSGIGDSAFENCTGLVSAELAEGVTSLGYAAFAGCEALAEINLPSSVSDIDEAAFRGCWQLTELTVPQGVSELKRETLYLCATLTTLTLPDSIASLGSLCCGDCKGLQTVVFGGTRQQWQSITKNSSWNTGSAAYAVVCTDGTLETN